MGIEESSRQAAIKLCAIEYGLLAEGELISEQVQLLGHQGSLDPMRDGMGK